MTGERMYNVNHTQRSLLAIMRCLEDGAVREDNVGDYQEALYLRWVRATMMRGVLEDDPADSAS